MPTNEYLSKMLQTGELVSIVSDIYLITCSTVPRVQTIVGHVLDENGEILSIEKREKFMQGSRYRYRASYYITAAIPKWVLFEPENQ